MARAEDKAETIANNQSPILDDELDFVSGSEAMQRVMRSVEQVAPTDISVLITGDSGTGKELIAKSIHAGSLRKDKPLVIVNCGAIPEGILESELFGHEKGSFTGAIDARKGYFELANSGTIFLDEIGEMPLATQVKILRVLENREFMRVGSATATKADVRVIAATNKNLEVEVRKGTFRQDLFFRLNAINIRIPPLRERRQDIRPLVDLFIGRFCRENHVEFEGFTESAYRVLEDYSWPGNVRELKNLVESVIVLERGRRIDHQTLLGHLRPVGDLDRSLPVPVGRSVEEVEREFIYRALIDLKDEVARLRQLIFERLVSPKALLPLEFLKRNTEAAVEVAAEDELAETVQEQSVAEMEKQLIARTLKSTAGNRRKAARKLGISERTLYRKIKQYGL
jgi:DNA-binding NtrC family response regulator